MTTIENFRNVMRKREEYRESIHKNKWFEGVGITKKEDEGDWCLLVFHKPGTRPKIPGEFEGVEIVKRAQLVKSSPKNTGKTEWQKAKKKADAAVRKEAKENPKPKKPWRDKKEYPKKSSAPKKAPAQPKKTEESAVEMPSRFKF